MPWCAIQTEPQRERLVRIILMRECFETYLPRIRVRQRVALLFPGYLFMAITERWWLALRTPHVRQILMAGTRPAALPENFIESLRSRSRNGFVRLPRPPTAFRNGQRVRITRGSFEGQFAVYEGMSGRERERVLLDLLGQLVPVVLPTQSLALA
jgi:transcription antitermination factor NusG